MAHIRMLDAVRLNDLGDVVRVRWGVADTALNQWHLQPEEADVIEVVDALLKSDIVATRKPNGAPGPEIRVVVAKGGHGIETIATTDPEFSVADFARF